MLVVSTVILLTFVDHFICLVKIYTSYFCFQWPFDQLVFCKRVQLLTERVHRSKANNIRCIIPAGKVTNRSLASAADTHTDWHFMIAQAVLDKTSPGNFQKLTAKANIDYALLENLRLLN